MIRPIIGKIKNRVFDLVLSQAEYPPCSIQEVEYNEYKLADEPELFNPDKNNKWQVGPHPLYVIKDPRLLVWSEFSIAGVNGTPIRETFIDDGRINSYKKRNLLRKYPIKRVDGCITTIDRIFCRTNYFHQFIDALPRSYALLHPVLQKEKIKLCISRELSEEQSLILKHMLPENVKITKVSRYVRLKPDSYIYLPYLSKNTLEDDSATTSGGFLPMEYLNFYRETVFDLFDTNDTGTGAKKIFITRANSSIRKLINEEEVREYLTGRGFEIIDPGRYSFKKQVQIFNSADIIVAQHGAALTNLLYTSDAKVIEIFSSKVEHYHYRYLAQSLNLDYSAVFLNGKSNHDDVYLPISKLNCFLE